MSALILSTSPVLAGAEESRASIRRKPKARALKTPTLAAVADIKSDRPLQLNFWPDEVRGVPNVALRGALFSISQEREMAKKRQRLASVEPYQIMFKGERWNQHDLDVWEMLLHFGRRQSYGQHIEFIASDLLKALGRGTGGTDYDELKEDISRLMGGVVEITFADTNETFIGSLIHNAFRDELTQRYVLVFDEKMRKLYDSGYTHVDWAQRNKLKGNSLAQWLHGFYATHAAPFEYKVETLRRLCGSKITTQSRLTDFRKPLRVALEKLKGVGAISSWSIDPKTDKLEVRRKASMSQQRYLQNKQRHKDASEFDGATGESARIDAHLGTIEPPNQSGFDSHRGIGY